MRIPPPEITSNYEGSSLNFALLSNEVHQKDIQFLSSLISIVLEMDNKALRFTRYVKWILLVDFIIIFVILSLSPLLLYWNCEYTFFKLQSKNFIIIKVLFHNQKEPYKEKKMRMRHNASLLLNFIFIHIFIMPQYFFPAGFRQQASVSPSFNIFLFILSTIFICNGMIVGLWLVWLDDFDEVWAVGSSLNLITEEDKVKSWFYEFLLVNSQNYFEFFVSNFVILEIWIRNFR